jgi:murein DD-endopeptidase MepM/ murein hydrolase activator NlpD
MSGADIILIVVALAVLGSVGALPWGGGWVWPVPTTQQGAAVISQEFRRPAHLGVDVMFRVGGRFVADAGTPVVAARAGRVWSTGHTARGWNVVLDHGAPWATFYQHLADEPVVKAGDVVTAGQRLGFMGVDPTDAAGVRHLHFAVWYKGNGDSASVDPGAAMQGWGRLTV